MMKNFWIPDIFLDRAMTVRVPTLHLKPASIRVYRDSTIRWAVFLMLHLLHMNQNKVGSAELTTMNTYYDVHKS